MIFAIATIVIIAIAITAFVLAPRMIERKVIYDLVPDHPCSFGYKMSWLAIKTRDTERVLDVLGLYDIEPSNWQSGIGTVYHEELGENRIFVSPPVRGWTFVVGLALPHPLGDRFIDKWSPFIDELAAEFPELQYYFSYPLIDFYAWARVMKGRLSRVFAIGDEGVILKKGRITKEEKALSLKLFELRGVSDLRDDAGGELVLYPTESHILKLAGQWGLDPTKLSGYEAEDSLGFIGHAPASWRPQRMYKAA